MSNNPDIQQRLYSLPQKIAQPFRQLLAAGQLNEDMLSTILDAGELADDHSKLLGFAVGFLHLRSQGIPIHDVIHMAKQQSRPINLYWSATRWKKEHERLSRAEALDRLARENLQYDVSQYEALLPPQFEGYLIRSSRRLGMEGLRQRHCVASYHNQLAAGHCAIATLFIDGQRWTVQLTATGHPDAPLRINQIKTRYNGIPSNSIRDKIHEMLAIRTNHPTATYTNQNNEHYTYMETLRCILPVLREHAVRGVTVLFDGCGDSGSIENISYDAPAAFDGQNLTVQHDITTCHFEDGQWVRTTQTAQTSLNQAIDELTYNYLDETGIDWYNNDGGYGELTINVDTGTVALDVNVRYSDSTNEFYAERDILTGEEI